MRILFIVPYTPNRIRVRPYNLIRYLSKAGHKVTVLTLSSDQKEQVDGAALAQHCHQVIQLPLARWRSLLNCLLALPSDMPLQSVYCWQPDLADQMDQLVNGQKDQIPFDVIHVEHLRGVRYGLKINELLRSNGRKVPVVWDSVDCISLLFRQASAQSQSLFGRWVTRLELGRTERYESWLLSRFQQILVTSAADKEALVDLNQMDETLSQVDVLPNGVDLEYFIPETGALREPATIVVTGKMSYHANISMVLHLVQDIMPLVWDQMPGVKLSIVGKDPSPAIQKLARHPAISVSGTVTDIRPYLRRATMAVAPLPYGAGIQNKILEAMACGTPVIANAQATKALTVVDGQDLLTAQNSKCFSEQILQLLKSKDVQNSLGVNGRAYVMVNHDWEAIIQQLESVYRRVIQQINQ